MRVYLNMCVTACRLVDGVLAALCHVDTLYLLHIKIYNLYIRGMTVHRNEIISNYDYEVTFDFINCIFRKAFVFQKKYFTVKELR